MANRGPLWRHDTGSDADFTDIATALRDYYVGARGCYLRIAPAVAENALDRARLGAAGFAWLDDWIGSRRTILIALVGLTVFGGLILLVQTKLWFWIFGVTLGIFFGPAQAASRSLMARMAPPDMRAEMFGLFAFSGKATAFLGPAILGWVTFATDSQRAGMATVLAFFVVGFMILWPLKEAGTGNRSG